VVEADAAKVFVNDFGFPEAIDTLSKRKRDGEILSWELGELLGETIKKVRGFEIAAIFWIFLRFLVAEHGSAFEVHLEYTKDEMHVLKALVQSFAGSDFGGHSFAGHVGGHVQILL